MQLSEEQWTALAEKIPARQLLAFRLIYSDGLTYEQAGQKMGINRNAVAMLVKRLRRDYPDCIPNRKGRQVLSFDILAPDEKNKEKF